jgi:serine/threonine protein kinase
LEVVQKYRVRTKFSHYAGTFGKVYRGYYMGREVALKVLKRLPDQKDLADYSQEVKILKMSKCQQIIECYGTVQDGEQMIIGQLFYLPFYS